MNKLWVLLVLVLVACNGNKEKVAEEEFFKKYPALKNAGSLKRDTVIYDADGNSIQVRVNPSDLPNHEIIESLNGSAVYEYTMKSGDSILRDSLGEKVIKRIYKYDYSNEFFEVHIKADTVEQGENFIGAIYGYQDDIVVNIDGLHEELTFEDLPYTYTIKAKDKGLNKFSGTIYTFGKEYPFEYVYWVE